MVPARHALLGIELHGDRDVFPHDPGFSLGSLQASERIDLDLRRGFVVPDAWVVLYRPGHAIRLDAYWGIGIGAAISGIILIVGAQVVNLLLGGPIIGSDTLSRFFALHVFVLPGAVLALVSLHLRLVLLKGINEYPTPGVQVRKETYTKEYEEMIHKDGMPFVPNGDRQGYRCQWSAPVGNRRPGSLCWTKRPGDSSGSGADHLGSQAGLSVSLVAFGGGPVAERFGDNPLFCGTAHRGDPFVWVAFFLQPRRETLQPATNLCDRRHACLPGHRAVDLCGNHRTMVAAHGG